MTLRMVSAQNVVVTGTITAADSGEGLPGANIIEKGTDNGTISDLNGKFSITVNADATLVISSIGYLTEEISVDNRSVIDVALVQNIQALEEVVVVGYGAVKKKDLTGAVAQIDAAAISHQSANSVTDILRANVPGLNVGFSNSPKGVSQLEVRGSNTLSASSRPLIVVDGMIYNGDLSDINPNDIDKVDVMKDASSAAVYGARGSNGVILITTKRGQQGKPRVTVNASVGLARDSFRELPYDAQGYVDWRVEVFKSINAGTIEDTPGRFDNPDNLPPGVTLDQWLAYDGASGDPTVAWLNRIGFQDIEIENYLAGRSIDWYDKIIQTGLRSDLNVNLSGGSESLKYFWSIGRMNNEGIVVGREFGTIRTRLNIEGKINDFITVGINAQFANRDEGSVAANAGEISRSSPWGSEFDDEGNIRLSPHDDPGVSRNAFLARTFTDRIEEFNTLNSRMYAKIALPLGFSYEFAFVNRYEWNVFLNHRSSKDPGRITGEAFRQSERIQEWQIDNILRWDKTFGDHAVNVTMLAYAEKFQRFLDRTTNSFFTPNDDLGFHNLSLGTAPELSGNDQKSTGDALMARVNYSYKSKYLLSLTIRRDGYSAFGQDNKRANFPSVSGGWVISEEGFFDFEPIDFLNVRASWGENGNREIGRYAALSRLSSGNNLIVDGSGNVQLVGTLNNFEMENRTLRWERTRAWNLGIDFSFMGGKIEGSVDAYHMITNDLLVRRALPNIIGFSSVFSNLGELENNGLEMVVTSRNIDKPNFSWNTTFNFSLNRNRLNSLYGDSDEEGNELDDIANRWFIGHAIDEIWGQKVLGVWQSDQEEEADVYGVRPGDFRILDKNNDGIFTIEDNEFLGFAKPRFRWTMVNSFRLRKNIDFSFEVYSHLGMRRAFNAAKNRRGFIDRTNSFQTPFWTPENPANDWARLFSSEGSANFNVYRNNSFVRLQNVTLSYTFPQTMLDRLSIESLRVYGNIRNVAVWSPDWDLFDPEPSEIDGTAGFTSTPRFFTLGLNVTL
ncbi:MAG: SusC/RagA family TonB-linked outer membrane protein [Cytophagales bacterium]|nr:SusC/RagA family TonB-linked outer membrane protein [Cytophagales bacterium]